MTESLLTVRKRYDRSRPARRIGQCREASRAPLQGLRPKGQGHPLAVPPDFQSVFGISTNVINPIAQPPNKGGVLLNPRSHVHAEPAHDNDHHSFEIWGPEEKVTMFRMMEIKYSRKN